MNQIRIPERRKIHGQSNQFMVIFENHFLNRPLRWHMTAWLLVGCALGLLIAPSYEAAVLAGFLISGILCCAVLGLLTYPMSDHFLWTLAGAFVGALLLPLAAGVLQIGQWTDRIVAVGLISGALLGATSMIWLLPLRLILRFLGFSPSGFPPTQ
ncbi:MAG: hypothetical protein ACR2NP_03480 [Pirellulaceae bacterium]